LAPLFTIALRGKETLSRVPGAEVNVSVALEVLGPELSTVAEVDGEDSASFYGLLMRFLPRLVSDDQKVGWTHRINLPARAPRERHGQFTNDLVDTHRAVLKAVAGSGGDGEQIPAISVHIGTNARKQIDVLHRISDWVISVDRFLGVELFDVPAPGSGNQRDRTYLLDYAPEFLEGVGQRMIVTTSHRDEVMEILGRAMHELGFGAVEESVGAVLDHLKAVSGRLALRMVGDDAHAREAVGLGVVAAYLRATGELENGVLVPVDAHPELFAPRSTSRRPGSSGLRCDLILFKLHRSRIVATLIEVKARSAPTPSDELVQRMIDQIVATEEVLRDLFFRKEPMRLDHVLQRSRLATIITFYVRRARRYGLIADDQRFKELENALAKYEASGADLHVERRGFVVNVLCWPSHSHLFVSVIRRSDS
jgi:DNA phosphorothioation-dependent restriction protein DptH